MKIALELKIELNVSLFLMVCRLLQFFYWLPQIWLKFVIQNTPVFYRTTGDRWRVMYLSFERDGDDDFDGDEEICRQDSKPARSNLPTIFRGDGVPRLYPTANRLADYLSTRTTFAPAVRQSFTICACPSTPLQISSKKVDPAL